jgi:hypothetical protein
VRRDEWEYIETYKTKTTKHKQQQQQQQQQRQQTRLRTCASRRGSIERIARGSGGSRIRRKRLHEIADSLIGANADRLTLLLLHTWRGDGNGCQNRGGIRIGRLRVEERSTLGGLHVVA